MQISLVLLDAEFVEIQMPIKTLHLVFIYLTKSYLYLFVFFLIKVIENKFPDDEVTTSSNLFLLRAKFDVYIRHGAKPTEEDHDFDFHLPKSIMDVDAAEDQFKIFVPQDEIHKTGVYYVGVKDTCELSFRD